MPTTTTTERTHVVNPGKVDLGYPTYPVDVFIEIKFGNRLNPDRPPELSITGVEGPKRNGDAWGRCGQIGGSARFRPDDGALRIDVLADGWTSEMVQRLNDIWQHWHNNGLRAGCEHQRAEGWNERPIDPDKPLSAYGKHFPGQRSDSWNMLTWVTRSEHPEGLLSHPCDVCGYRYGTAWLHEEVPQEILDWLFALPATTKEPAWV